MRKALLTLCCLWSLMAKAQVWQWSVPIDGLISSETNASPQAFLWIPENCKKVRGIVLGQHNMVEEGMLGNPNFRKTMAEIGFAEIWVTPGFDMTFDFHNGADKHLKTMIKALANVSGYDELRNVPFVPIGHSAYASYPWNFGAWNPARTLAIVSIHGDTPLTNLTGSGKPNPDWGTRTIEGIPSLFVMGEYEWWEKRIAPGFDYIKKHPKTPISFFCDAGHGHFDYNDPMVDYVAMFIKKAAQNRISRKPNTALIPIEPKKGWLMDRWRKDSLPTAQAKKYLDYQGDRGVASWCFDKEMVDRTEAFYAKARTKKEQFLGFIQNGSILKPTKSHANYQLKFIPLEDGISFRLNTFFADTSKIKIAKNHANTKLSIDRICGPVKKLDDSTFQVSFYRMGFNNPKRSNDIWLLAHNEGDDVYKSTVQQLAMRFPIENKEGVNQIITFESIPHQKSTIKYLDLKAHSSASLPISFYVKQGPAWVEGNKLVFTKIPPKSKFPILVTVVAWQYGIPNKVQTAKPIEMTFELIP